MKVGVKSEHCDLVRHQHAVGLEGREAQRVARLGA
jgi:hypothetical protein